MNTVIKKEGDVSILSLTGSLDTNTSKEAEDQINILLEEGSIKLLIDLTDLDYISSSGLRILLSISKKLKSLRSF